MAPDFLPVSNGIVLTAFRPEDKPSLLRWMEDDTIHRFTSHIPHPYTDADADAWLNKTREMEEQYPARPNWAIRTAAGKLIGGIGRLMRNGADSHCDEIGYWLAQPYRGKGLMSLVVQRFCDYWFTYSPLIRIEARVYHINPASARVLEKAGFDYEGLQRRKMFKNGQYLDVLLYARLKD